MIPFPHLSFWEQQSYLEDIDLLIIGSGIVGLSTAIHLKQARPHQKIVVLERGYIPTGASTKNAGFACLGSPSEILSDLKSNDQRKIELRKEEGDGSGCESESENGHEKQHSNAVHAHETDDLPVWITYKKRFDGLNYLRELLGDEAIDYREEGSYELFRDSDRKKYRDCLEALPQLNEQIEKITGVKDNFQEDLSIIESSGMKGFCGAISIKAEGMINTGKLMTSLISKAASLGVMILNGINVEDGSWKMEARDSRISGFSDSRLELTTNYGFISASKIAICTNGLASQLLDLDVNPARAQVVVTSPLPNLPFKGTYHLDEGYYYFRNIGNRILLGGGRNLDFEAEETDELNTSDQIINHLSSLLETHILPHQSFTIDYHWAGTMGVGSTKAPIIREVAPNLYCGVRLGGMGVAIGSLVGKELAEMMTEDG